MAISTKIAVLIGSTRPVRIGPQVERFVHDVITKRSGSSEVDELQAGRSVKLDILDLKNYSLPIFDELFIPNRVTSPDGLFTRTHTRVVTDYCVLRRLHLRLGSTQLGYFRRIEEQH